MAHLYEQLPEKKRGTAAATSQELLPALLSAVRGGDAVTVKGSLGSRMGLLAEALRVNLSKPPSDKNSRDASLGVGYLNVVFARCFQRAGDQFSTCSDTSPSAPAVRS